MNFNSLKHSYGLRGLTRLMTTPVLYGPVIECKYLEVGTKHPCSPTPISDNTAAAAGHLLSIFCDKEAVNATQ